MLISKIKPILTETGEKLEASVKREPRSTRQKLLYAYKHPEQTTYGCHHEDSAKDNLLQKVIKLMADTQDDITAYAACSRLFGKDHYRKMPWLYRWCHDHQNEILVQRDILRSIGK